jgi:hypothetical protein
MNGPMSAIGTKRKLNDPIYRDAQAQLYSAVW